MAEIDSVGSVGMLVIMRGPGDTIRPTVDLPPCPIRIHLSNDSMLDVIRDHRRVAELARRVFHVE